MDSSFSFDQARFFDIRKVINNPNSKKPNTPIRVPYQKY